MSSPDPGAGLPDAEHYLAGLEPVGWRFGLDRMRALCDELGRPQDRYRTLHVVGTNGKSSVATMAAALLDDSGLRSGACISPHVWRWSERTRIGGREIEPGPFAAAVERVAAGIEAVERRLGTADDGTAERITQFEAAIAVSFVAFEEAGVDVAVVEAGLGGRLDATNVIASTATALTSVGLDHVEWLGETEVEIAIEKLAVLRTGTTLVVGALEPEIAALAERTAAERDARLVVAPALPDAELPDGMAPYLRRNAAVAAALAGTITGPMPHDRIAAAVRSAQLRGRAERIDGDPPVVADAAHNEAGARALAEALPALAAGRPVFGCLSVLADKDAAAIARALAPHLNRAVCTAADPGPAMGRPGAKAFAAGALAELVAGAGVAIETVADPATAVARTLRLARDHGGVALFAGSHYLLRYLWNGRNAPNYSR
jgi:dihydrofolate synthase / folylpolyglutamate synthase